jgi:ABC-type Fe2+-enterobactin transport system substrate-binding protein
VIGVAKQVVLKYFKMWGNLTGVVGKATGVVGKAIQNVKKFHSELESQLDAAVGKDDAIGANEVSLPSSVKEDSEKQCTVHGHLWGFLLFSHGL